MRSALLALGLLPLLVACNPTDAEDLQTDGTKMLETTVRSATNASVAVKVTTALSLRKGVEIGHMKVEAEGSTVTLSGHVHSQKEKDLILEITRETKGVEKVIDNLVVDAH